MLHALWWSYDLFMLSIMTLLWWRQYATDTWPLTNVNNQSINTFSSIMKQHKSMVCICKAISYSSPKHESIFILSPRAENEIRKGPHWVSSKGIGGEFFKRKCMCRAQSATDCFARTSENQKLWRWFVYVYVWSLWNMLTHNSNMWTWI